MTGNPSLPNPGLTTSLPEVHGTVVTRHPSRWKRLFAFAGPAYLVSVGYMDPGNWATDLEGGARFGYQLLWVLAASNLMAILLQTLSARLGIVTQRDLAQACRESYSRPVCYALWGLCEIAIAACDLAEVLGAAIALNLLFHLPLIAGVLITVADTLLVLWFTRLGIRLIESLILVLVLTIAICFSVEIYWAGAEIVPLIHGFVPRLNDQSLYVAIGILGATVMPHNLYLHSALVQTRRIGTTAAEKATACKFNFLDSAVALNGALFVNAAILVLAAAIFYKRGIVVTEIQQAHVLLSPLLGTGAASVIFAVALLASGQSSTLTGTMAGQIVMEGFLSFRMRPWLRRLTTRMLAVIPAVLTIYFIGDKGTYQLLILSQVILSLQLPFAVLPLVAFTSDRRRMGQFVNPWWVKIIAWSTGVLIVGLNLRLIAGTLTEWMAAVEPNYRWPAGAALAMLLTSLGALLLWIALAPLISKTNPGQTAAAPLIRPAALAPQIPEPTYSRILVPLDHSNRDRAAVAHASAIARNMPHGPHPPVVHLIHVEEDVTSQVYGALASTAEVEAGHAYLTGIADALHRQGVKTQLVVRHSQKPMREIVQYARQIQADLVVMGAHGHKGLQDLVFGATIEGVRHGLSVPVLIVRGDT